MRFPLCQHPFRDAAAGAAHDFLCNAPRHWRRLLGPLLLAALTCSGTAAAQSGLVGRAEALPDVTLSSGMPLAEKPLVLQSGTYYELIIVSDGSAEMAISGAAFFRNIWIDEIVINDIEIRPMGLDSIEFDAEGEVEISFIPIKPGRFELTAPGVPPLPIEVQG